MFRLIETTANSRGLSLACAPAPLCAGLDWPAFLQAGPESQRALLARTPSESPANLAQRACWIWQEVPMPVIAALHGAVFGGALGVGLGFGLQKVASNYISGFIILLERSIMACNEKNAALAEAVGGDRKSKLSLLIYIAAMPLAFVSPWIAIALYVGSALMWFIPDHRIETTLLRRGDETSD